jgi:hypothetical protein
VFSVKYELNSYICMLLEEILADSRGHKTRNPSDRKLLKPQSRSGSSGDNVVLPLPGLEPQFVSGRSCRLVAVPTEQARFLCVRWTTQF